MRVQLIAHTVLISNVPGYIPHSGFPMFDECIDDLGEQAGRECYLSWPRLNPATATNKGYMENIINQGHFSVTEHGTATFYIDGVTRNLTHELIRHRHLSYSEVSQRYVDATQLGFVAHPGLADIDDEACKDLSDALAAAKKAYDSIHRSLVARGIEGKKARQVARHALPSGTGTQIVVSGNMRAWRDMLWKRLSLAADDEIRMMAEMVLTELKKIAPNTFQDFADPNVSVEEVVQQQKG